MYYFMITRLHYPDQTQFFPISRHWSYMYSYMINENVVKYYGSVLWGKTQKGFSSNTINAEIEVQCILSFELDARWKNQNIWNIYLELTFVHTKCQQCKGRVYLETFKEMTIAKQNKTNKRKTNWHQIQSSLKWLV